MMKFPQEGNVAQSKLGSGQGSLGSWKEGQSHCSLTLPRGPRFTFHISQN
jgi:hypothetical protein